MSSQRQFLLGIFFLTALGLLGFYTLFLTDFQFFGEPVTMQVGFKDAHGLREGDPVMIKGLRQGRVKSLRYEPTAPDEHKILAVLHLNYEIVLTDQARIVIKESTLLGGRQVNIRGVRGLDTLQRPEIAMISSFVLVCDWSKFPTLIRYHRGYRDFSMPAANSKIDQLLSLPV